MTAFYEFHAYNSQTLYGYGNERDADLYADYLNANREINMYGVSPISKYHAKKLYLANRDDIVDLDEARDLLDKANEMDEVE